MDQLSRAKPDRARVLTPKWYTVADVADMLGYGLRKTKMLVASGQLRSLKDGGHRRILPEWVDEYVARRVREAACDGPWADRGER